MANYIATARSNYFRVKNAEAFKAWASEVLVSWRAREGTDHFMIYADDSDGWPAGVYDDEGNETRDFNLVTELATHLTDTSIAIVMEVGAEKLRYLEGWAVAVNAKGETVGIALRDIYQEAAEHFGDAVEITEATY